MDDISKMIAGISPDVWSDSVMGMARKKLDVLFADPDGHNICIDLFNNDVLDGYQEILSGISKQAEDDTFLTKISDTGKRRTYRGPDETEYLICDLRKGDFMDRDMKKRYRSCCDENTRFLVIKRLWALHRGDPIAIPGIEQAEGMDEAERVLKDYILELEVNKVLSTPLEGKTLDNDSA